MNFAEAKQQIVMVSHDAHARGWVPATSGNFSARLTDGDIAITVSGKDKGKLSDADIMRMGQDGISHENLRPSAETRLHLQLYLRDNSINAVLHTHSLNATIASQSELRYLRFDNLEILKAFAGIASHEASIKIPIFDNNQDIDVLAEAVEQHMAIEGQGVGYLISGHGLYTWGNDMDDCLRHLEAIEYLLEYHRLTSAVPIRSGTS